MSGEPELFRALIGSKVDKLADILRRDALESTLEDERLERFAKVLGIVNGSSAYEHLKQGRTRRKGWRQFVELPHTDAATAKNEKRENRNRAKRERRQLEQRGLLLLRDERRMPPHGCAVERGFVVAWPDYTAGAASIDVYQTPWRAGISSGTETQPHIGAVSSDAVGRRIAMAAGNVIRVWDINGETWKSVANIPEADPATGLAMTADGTRMAHSSRNEIVVTRIADGEALARLPGRLSKNMAFHPSGDWLVATGRTLGLIDLRRALQWRDVSIRGSVSAGSLFGALLESHMARLDSDSVRGRVEATTNAIEFPESYAAAVDEAQALRAVTEATEQVRCAGFSRDGQWLWCGTNAGLRIYRWESVTDPSLAGEMPQPTWHYECLTEPASESSGDILAIVEEAGSGAVVFGGRDGRLYRFDLKTGNACQLAKLPGHARVRGLAMATDGATLGVAGIWAPGMPAEPKDYRSTWDIWSYPHLRQTVSHIA
ncbi:MAG TPA: WD40 repeat domain-containing protein [Gemmatimonadaceae bacterium]